MKENTIRGGECSTYNSIRFNWITLPLLSTAAHKVVVHHTQVFGPAAMDTLNQLRNPSTCILDNVTESVRWTWLNQVFYDVLHY